MYMICIDVNRYVWLMMPVNFLTGSLVKYINHCWSAHVVLLWRNYWSKKLSWLSSEIVNYCVELLITSCCYETGYHIHEAGIVQFQYNFSVNVNFFHSFSTGFMSLALYFKRCWSFDSYHQIYAIRFCLIKMLIFNKCFNLFAFSVSEEMCFL